MKKEIEKAVKLLTALISTPSLSREEDQTAQIIQDFLEGEGVAVSRTGNNIIAKYEGAEVDSPYIMLCSHHDTVKPNSAYTRDPYNAEIIGGKLFGLGSNDAGASLVCLITTFVFLSKSKAKVNLLLAAVAEEEVSGSNGVLSILADLPPIDLAIVGEVGIQLSGREGIATTFDVENLNETAQVRYEGEGWGLCLQGEELVMSDNTGTLVRRDAQTLAVVAPQPSPEDLTNLRALECANQWIWAVVGDTNTIAVINAESGRLDGLLDTTDLLPNTAGPNDALAAIAFNPITETFYVAGRRWGVFYEISVEFPAS